MKNIFIPSFILILFSFFISFKTFAADAPAAQAYLADATSWLKEKLGV